MYRHDITTRIAEVGLVGIVRSRDPASSAASARALLAAGLDVVEVSLTTPGALELIASLAQDYPGALVGVGTVLDEASARLAILAGARFLVAPNLDAAVVRCAHRYGAAAIPGVGTAGEAVRALDVGADLVKVFPASTFGGPGALKDMLSALPQVPAVPTGGVSVASAPDWIRAGAVAVGMGSALTAGTPDQARERVAGLLQSISDARQLR